ncbi:hypothetical protein [Verrucosispora sioxanthis]|uniref:hypothetical protein n=1 Tax=Verrucosispora sioxanthis TaxID=2499994 RepID=UPI001C102E8C|nr:hypothetical protein [Verrucosispora sioxanthis]
MEQPGPQRRQVDKQRGVLDVTGQSRGPVDHDDIDLGAAQEQPGLRPDVDVQRVQRRRGGDHRHRVRSGRPGDGQLHRRVRGIPAHRHVTCVAAGQGGTGAGGRGGGSRAVDHLPRSVRAQIDRGAGAGVRAGPQVRQPPVEAQPGATAGLGGEAGQPPRPVAGWQFDGEP